jgi:putative ABC transport system permease protein
MNCISQIIKESIHRRINFILSLLAMVVAVSLFVAFHTSGTASKRETVRLMRDLGYNLRIIPKSADKIEFLANGYTSETMPEENVDIILAQGGLTYNHLLAVLHKRITWQDKEAILTGLAAEQCPSGKGKSSMIFQIKEGDLYIGYQLAVSLGIKKGDNVNLKGQDFRVERCLAESGSDEDIRIYAHLRDVQNILNMPGRINEIKALECLCASAGKDTMESMRAQLESVMPSAEVLRLSTIYSARKRQRMMSERYFDYIMTLVLLVCAVWIGSLAMANVRERQVEIGVMRALGYGSGSIAALFLGKAALIGIVGGTIGFYTGTALAVYFGANMFHATAGALRPEYGLLLVSLLAAPVFAAMASLIPVAVAVAQDPAEVLKEI